MPYGLTKSTISRINEVFDQYPEIERVILYGSRAKGTFNNGSDIDLVCVGKKLTHALVRDASKDLDNLLLPYSIDLSILESISNQELLEHIERVGIVFYHKP